MLRDLKHGHLGCVLTPFKVTASGGSATLSYGGGSFSAAASGATGVSTLTLKRAGHRDNGSNTENVVFGCVESSSSAGYFVDGNNAAIPHTSFVARVKNQAGTATDSLPVHGLGVRWESPNVDKTSPLSTVSAESFSQRMMGFRITSSNTISIGGGQGTLTAVATGQRRITFSRAFAQAPIVIASPISTNQKAAQVGNITASSVDIFTQDSAEAAENVDVDVIVIGQDSTTSSCGAPVGPVRVPQRNPRLEVGVFTVAPAVLIGTGDMTVSSGGAGVRTVTFSTPFKRAPICVVMGRVNRAQIRVASTTSSVGVLTSNAAGVADTDEFSLLALGYDDAVEY